MLKERLQNRKRLDLLRKLTTSDGLIDLTSNDYFGFARRQRSQNSCPGSTGSRLLTGNSPLFEELEKKIARFHKAESCLIYSSGYTANLGLISTLGKEATFLYDLEIHASMIDGMLLSEGKRIPFRHNDLHSLEERLRRVKPPVFVLIESIYSISGDIAPIQEIADLCSRYQVHLIVDEAHATGVCGVQGEGLVKSQVFAKIHTFSKALGAHGACVLGSHDLKEYLINYSRPFIYTTALPPSLLLDIGESYERLAREAAFHQEKLRRLIAYFCKKTGSKETHSPIRPLRTENVRALSQTLREKGIDVRAILPPTVGKGKECLRVVLHSFNEESEIDQLLEVLE